MNFSSLDLVNEEMSADDEQLVIVIHDKILQEEAPSSDLLRTYIAVATHLIIFLCMLRLYIDG